MQTQASTTLTRGGCAFRLGVALLLALLPLVPASARVQRPVHHNDAWARQQFARAERMREALNGRPLGERTRREYQRVIDSYRRVYFSAPASSKADPSVVRRLSSWSRWGGASTITRFCVARSTSIASCASNIRAANTASMRC